MRKRTLSSDGSILSEDIVIGTNLTIQCLSTRSSDFKDIFINLDEYQPN